MFKTINSQYLRISNYPDNIRLEDVFTEENQVKLDNLPDNTENDSYFDKLMKDEDFKQKLSMIVTVTIELYRVMMSSLLLMFVPQACGDEQCSISDKLNTSESYESFVLCMNFLTLFNFTITYAIESKRENILINYLDVNRFKPRDNESVSKQLKSLSSKRLNRIHNYDSYYKNASYISMITFTLNSLFSSIVIFSNFLDSKTITVLLTNMLFMSSKLYDMYSIANTKECIFLSAYLTRKVQFNDVDKDKIELKENDLE